MPLEFYKVLHICGILAIFSGLLAMFGAMTFTKELPASWRRSVAIVHGLGMAIVLISGFGMLHHVGGYAPWVTGKLVIWLLLGGSVALAKRRAQLGFKLVALWIALGTCAAYLALYKPGL